MPVKKLKLITIQEKQIKYELEWYNGSLDFPCDFCDSNSYQNFHITVGGELTVVCEDCLKRTKELHSRGEQ